MLLILYLMKILVSECHKLINQILNGQWDSTTMHFKSHITAMLCCTIKIILATNCIKSIYHHIIVIPHWCGWLTWFVYWSLSVELGRSLHRLLTPSVIV